MTDDDFEAAVAEAVKLEQADAKLVALERLRANVLKERRSLRALTIVSIVAACVAVWLGLTVRASLAESEASRASARHGSCVQDNIRIDQHNALVDADEATLRDIIPSSHNPATITFLTDHIQQYEKTRVPQRDCSPAGIEMYLGRKQ